MKAELISDNIFNLLHFRTGLRMQGQLQNALFFFFLNCGGEREREREHFLFLEKKKIPFSIITDPSIENKMGKRQVSIYIFQEYRVTCWLR